MKPKNANHYLPLATRLRPKNLTDYVGQTHLLSEGKPLRRAIDQGMLHSMILWGPPGTGKTTLAELFAHQSDAHFERLSAVFSGVKEIRLLVEQSKKIKSDTGQATVLFIDEIHRFNKAQQDVFLPYIEDGTFILIGATTENPSFELNNALLSRARVYVLKSLTVDELSILLKKAIAMLNLHFPEPLQPILVAAADGDARQLYNLLEVLADFLSEGEAVTETVLQDVLQTSLRRFDKQGEAFYDQISALHKSVRGSSPDAALYWFCRMIDGGCDPRYLARRIIRMSIEDVGNADPRALQLAINAADTYERLGSPEGELALAQAIVYLSVAAKSNAVYVAFNAAMHDAKQSGSLEVPLHLRNAPTKLMKSLDYGKDYRYAHDEKNAYAAGETYMPPQLKNKVYYEPSGRGLENKIAEKLAYLKELDKKV